MATHLTHRERYALGWLAAQGGHAIAQSLRNLLTDGCQSDYDLVAGSLIGLKLINKVDSLHGAPWFEITPAGVEAVTAHPDWPAPPADGAPCTVDRAPASSRATVCIDEADLDDWWDGLDVELKSAAFLNYTFGAARSEVDVEAEQPIVYRGTVGENDAALVESWRYGRVQRLPESLRHAAPPASTLCLYCHAPFAGPLCEASISRCASLLRRVCNRRECQGHWYDDIEAARDALARGGVLGGEPNIQDAERAGD